MSLKMTIETITEYQHIQHIALLAHDGVYSI